MKIPFVDLLAQYQSIRQEIDVAIANIIESTTFIGGPPVKEFEARFAQYSGCETCIGVGNGTDAIYAVLRCLGIGPGDEVITVANSWISTSETISQTGAKPVFIDVDEYFHIDPTKIEEKINRRTKAVIPVHLYGQPAAVDLIADVCRRRGLHLIEDCAQAHGASFRNKRVGTFGIAGTFSFYPGKNLGAYGDAGAVVTNDESLGRKLRMFCNHGAETKHHHEMEGINSRLDSIQAAILTVKMAYIDKWTNARRQVAAQYCTGLSGLKNIELPKMRPNGHHVFHLFVVKSRRRDELMLFLKSKGIDTQIHYPTALPLLPAYGYLGYSHGDLPVASSNQDQIVSLPIFPEMSAEMVAYICNELRTFDSSYGELS